METFSDGSYITLMPVSRMQWHVEIEIFNILAAARYFKKQSLRILCPQFSCCVFFHFTFLLLSLYVCGDIHLNPGPTRNRPYYNFSICHWNLNSTTAHNYEKINLLQAYNTVNKFEMICISESYLDSSISPDSEQLNIESHKLIGNNHPGNVRTRGVCAYFRESLPIRFISKSHLNECLILEVSVSNEKGYEVSLYRSPS